jgi:hypothetical protein
MKSVNQISTQQLKWQQRLQNNYVSQMRTLMQNRTKYNTQGQDWESL